MNIEEMRLFALTLQNATEDMPFDETTVVFRVENKIFMAIGMGHVDPKVTVKCDPEIAVELRERYEAVEPAFHWNKKYWNDIYLNRDMKPKEVREQIKNSFTEVVKKIPKKLRQQYEI